MDLIIDVARRLGFKARVDRVSFKRSNVPVIVLFAWYPDDEACGVHAVVWDPFERRVIDPGTDHAFKHPTSFYHDKWKASNYLTIAVTGKL